MVERFIHMSTDEVYGSVEEDISCLENALFAPSNPYAATKAGAEMICQAYVRSYNLPIIITRCNNAISPFQHSEKLIPQCIECFNTKRKIKIHGDGSAKRTFIYGNDIASALDIIAEKGEVGKVYNIGTEMEYTVLEVVDFVLKCVFPGSNINDWIEFTSDRPFQDKRYCINSTALRNLGWKEEISFHDAVKLCIENT
jgi:dTDP-D-glucose 4,6-dehydratase